MTIGLFGGTFNPPHAGHRMVAETALRACALHRIWWMVSPGNPLKPNPPPPIADRIALSRKLARDPQIVVTDVEAEMGTRFTIDSIRMLQRLRPGVRFVYVMGADSFATLERWKDWRAIMAAMPVIVVDRPGATLAAARSVAARTFADARQPERDAPLIAFRRAPAWVLLYGPRSPLSSTDLRRRAGNP